MKKIMLALFVLAFTCPASANNDVVEGAVGFMIGGDDGWSGFTEDYNIDGCKVSFVQKKMGVRVVVTYDWNKANYKSAITEYVGNRTFFTISGQKGLSLVTATSISDGSDESEFAKQTLGLEPGASKSLSFPMETTMDRFKVAFSDLQSECPGKTSKY